MPCQQLTFALLVLLSAAPGGITAAHSADPRSDFAEHPAFPGAQLGSPFDSARQGPPKSSGRPCVGVGGPNPQGGDVFPVVEEGEGVLTMTQSRSITSKSDLRRALKVGNSLSLNTLLYGVHSEYDHTVQTVEEAKVTSSSETSYRHRTLLNPWQMIDEQAGLGLQLSEPYLSWSKDEAMADQFRARCGDSFVIGILHGVDIGAVVQTSQNNIEKFRRLNQNLKVSLEYQENAMDFNRHSEEIFDQVQVESTYDVKTINWPAELVQPDTLEELDGELDRLSSLNLNTSRPYQVRTISYSRVSNIRPRGLLDPVRAVDAVSTLVDALWDLKWLQERLKEFYDDPDHYAIGKKGDRIWISYSSFLAATQKTAKTQFEFLKTDVETCVDRADQQRYLDACVRLAEWYQEHDTSEFLDRTMPKRKTDLCASPVSVELALKSNAPNLSFILQPTKLGGDDELGGKVYFQIWAEIVPDELEAFLNVSARWEEPWGDPTEGLFKSKVAATTFETSETVSFYELSQSECVFDEYPVGVNVLEIKPTRVREPIPTDVHGFASLRDYRSPRLETILGEGIIASAECMLDTDGSDAHKIGCNEIRFNPVKLRVVNRLDLEARSPSIKLPTAPRLEKLMQ